MYNPMTGQQKLWEWNAASRTWGAFVQDTWKARRNLTVTLGFRFDDQGNPWSRSRHDGLRQLLSRRGRHGRGANGERRRAADRTRRSIDRPRPSTRGPALPGTSPATGSGWCAAGRASTRTGSRRRTSRRSSAATRPGLILPTFFEGTSTPPIFVQGTSDTPPFGFRFPPLADRRCVPRRRVSTRRAASRGAAFPIGGNQPGAEVSHGLHLRRRPWSASLAASLSGSVHLQRLALDQSVGNGNQAGLVSYGVNINATARGSAGQAAGIAADAAQSQLRLDQLRRQRSRRQLQRR